MIQLHSGPQNAHKKCKDLNPPFKLIFTPANCWMLIQWWKWLSHPWFHSLILHRSFTSYYIDKVYIDDFDLILNHCLQSKPNQNILAYRRASHFHDELSINALLNNAKIRQIFQFCYLYCFIYPFHTFPFFNLVGWRLLISKDFIFLQ